MITDNPNPEIAEETPTVPVAEIPQEPAPVPTPRNQFVSVPEPKIKQFTGRATQKEYDRINAALAARKREGTTYDIVRFCLDMMDNIEDDFLQTFITK
ncbi:hypothetical protein IDJ77_11295 [Mucilaginibacter sp. ZT4R22]|uniref:Uncharacterized protein n=1 Tax=Mucilaginibacter pankratovii TaxID=2772110 RepID=A0ABR7WPZ8_9SPHI|nr:hypothetical protein [Mucilaginibacter pankratovii]MBD1364394.1 hypothetical protein [Mucilaginibacter pankratovii]